MGIQNKTPIVISNINPYIGRHDVPFTQFP